MTTNEIEYLKRCCEECRDSIDLGLVYKERVVPARAYCEYCTKVSCYLRNNLETVPTEKEWEADRRHQEHLLWWTEHNAN